MTSSPQCGTLYDTTDQSAALETAELDAGTVEDPAVGITIRLPLHPEHRPGAGRGVKATAPIQDRVDSNSPTTPTTSRWRASPNSCLVTHAS